VKLFLRWRVTLQRTGKGSNRMPDEFDRPAPSSQLLKFLHRLEDMFLVGLFMMMLGMAVLQIFLREVFAAGLSWGDLFVRMLVLWICLFGAMVASRQDKHINIDIFTRYMPDRVKHFVVRIVRFVTAAICLIMAWQGIKLVQLDLEHGTIAFGAMPAWICEAIIPVGFVVMALRYLILLIHSFQNNSGHRP
jgi:TRAP-type C4-dicarboxylate transport system permease small subunit